VSASGEFMDTAVHVAQLVSASGTGGPVVAGAFRFANRASQFHQMAENGAPV
jgi:hypothetical protein